LNKLKTHLNVAYFFIAGVALDQLCHAESDKAILLKQNVGCSLLNQLIVKPTKQRDMNTGNHAQLRVDGNHGA